MVQASIPVPKTKLQLCDFQSYTRCGKKALSALYHNMTFTTQLQSMWKSIYFCLF